MIFPNAVTSRISISARILLTHEVFPTYDNSGSRIVENRLNDKRTSSSHRGSISIAPRMLRIRRDDKIHALSLGGERGPISTENFDVSRDISVHFAIVASIGRYTRRHRLSVARFSIPGASAHYASSASDGGSGL